MIKVAIYYLLFITSHSYLHGHKSVVHHHLFGKKICSNCSFVLIAEFLVYILVHQRSFPHSVVKRTQFIKKKPLQFSTLYYHYKSLIVIKLYILAL